MIQRADEERPVRCAVYCRKSTDENLDSDFNSLDSQRAKAEAFIQSQENWVALDEHYDDGGYTGANTDRPALQQLLADMEAGQFDIIVVYRSDRLSRSILDFLRLLERMQKADVGYVSVTEAFSTKTSAGRLMMHLLLSFAEYERELVSERTKHKIAGAKVKGKWCGGSPILGYDVAPEGGRLIVNDEEAERVGEIFALYLKHGSLIPTVQEANRRGWVNKRWTSKKGIERGGSPWLKNTLHHMLTNITYTGRVRFQGEIYEGEHEAIVDEETWAKVQRRLKQNGRSKGGTQRNRYGALLRGLLYCGHCGKPMTHAQAQKGSRRYRYYRCASNEKQGAAACPTGALPAAEIERFVVDELKVIGKDEAVIAETLKAARAGVEEEVAALEDERRSLQKTLATYGDRMREVVVASPTEANAGRLADLQERIATVQRRLAEIDREIHAAQAEQIREEDLRAALADFSPLWNELNGVERARVVRLLVERVTYDRAEGTVAVTFRPSGIRALAGEGVA